MIFSAGPAKQNQQVIKRMAQLIKRKPSILEVSHRSQEFQTLLNDTKQTLRKLLDVPDEMEILFLSGGASFQFQMIPANLLHKKAGYLLTGLFSRMAYEAGCAFGNCEVIYDNTNHPYELSDFPWEIKGDYDYVHLCLNNSLYGTRTPDVVCDCPLIADVSSILGIEKIDFSSYALCYASAQKNFGMSAMTLVFIRKDLRFKTGLIPLISYKDQMQADSLLNTPPVSAIVMCKLIAEELLKRKSSLYDENRKKAELFYEFLDHQIKYLPLVQTHRSMMNCSFQMKDNISEQKFLEECEAHGIIGLKGHRQTGHLRASFSVHNTVEEVKTLIEFMKSR